MTFCLDARKPVFGVLICSVALSRGAVAWSAMCRVLVAFPDRSHLLSDRMRLKAACSNTETS